MHEYLVHHGCAGHLGRFQAEDGAAFARGTAVVVQSRRGPGAEGPLLAALGERHDLIVRLHDLTTEPAVEDEAEDDHGGCESCGNGGCESCSSEGGGHGGCTSCSAGGAQEVASYFAE